MKRIEMIIDPESVPEVWKALDKAGCSDIAVSAVQMRVEQQAWTRIVRSGSYKECMVARSRVEILVSDSIVDRIIQTIRSAADDGGRGEVRIYDVAAVISVGGVQGSTAA